MNVELKPYGDFKSMADLEKMLGGVVARWLTEHGVDPEHSKVRHRTPPRLVHAGECLELHVDLEVDGVLVMNGKIAEHRIKYTVKVTE